ncbi:MAG: antitoxin Xre/MbcA/ParS toxin-binding domain-containing protein [Burkholderiales bacterium]
MRALLRDSAISNHTKRPPQGKLPSFSDLVSIELDGWRAIQLIQNRLPARVVIQAARYLHVAPQQLSSALSLRRTLSHPTSDPNRPLSQFETERLIRLADLTRLAVTAFGESTAATKWLCAANIALAGESPLAMAATDIGAREVRRVISSVAYGAAL